MVKKTDTEQQPPAAPTVDGRVLGEAAYVAYADAVGWRDGITGLPIVTWQGLPAGAQSAWSAAAKAVLAKAAGGAK